MEKKKVLIIGICGASGSGKTTLDHTLNAHFGKKHIVHSDSWFQTKNASRKGLHNKYGTSLWNQLQRAVDCTKEHNTLVNKL